MEKEKVRSSKEDKGEVDGEGEDKRNVKMSQGE